MRIVVSVMLVASALSTVGCDDKKPEAKPAATATAAATAPKPAAAPPAHSAAPGGW